MSNCDICGVEYTKIKSWQKFCSKKCKDINFFSRNPKAKSLYNKKASRTPNFKYHVQKSGAKRRGIGFLLSFKEWWEIWQPHWENRGKLRSSLVMCRRNDCGDYIKGNVFIDTYSSNSSFAAANSGRKRDIVTGRWISHENN